MNKYNITKKFLYKEYIINKKSMAIIAKEIGCSKNNIFKALKKHNIKARTKSEADKIRIKISKYSKILTKEFLIKQYITLKKPAQKIAKEIEGCERTILNYLIKYNIIRRNANELNKGRYTDGRSLKPYYCIDCGKEISVMSGIYGKGRCGSCARKGKNSPRYIENLVRKYPIAFNNFLKEQIRKRDNHTCQICGKLERDCNRKLDVHHIDYDKDNLNINNLISLCQSCHLQTNGNKEIYIEFFGILKEIIN